ncbi:hypothetical protein CH339_10020 [Rhodobium orientis]|uniref:Phosphatidic acid phosphatase type 2/haloperoxidase domain-containing protein n=2 Tax=Rhodobium orientis TaxID=34017 RepID=A0A327JQB2_9HYPH|nr:hypothetical protein [Rhodobium orientis]RAI27563.1 hypothetical protein CH339_10020 [Rhodobium orientis]
MEMRFTSRGDGRAEHGYRGRARAIGRRLKANAASAYELIGRRGRASRTCRHPFRAGRRFEDFLGIALLLVGFAAVFLDPFSVEFRRTLTPEIARTFRSITDLGKSDWILIPTGLFCIFLMALDWTRLNRRMTAALSTLVIYVGYVFTSVAASGIVVIALKVLCGRARPKYYDQLGAFDFSPFTTDAGYASFPSGHATTIFALVTAGFFIFRRARLLLFAIAFWSAVSRFIIGAHYPSDLAMGMLIGISFSYWLARQMAVRRLGFRIDRGDGSIKPLHTRWPLVAGRELVHIARERWRALRPF